MFNEDVTDLLKDDIFKLIEGEVIIYDNIDDASNNYNPDYLKPNRA